ncbi:DNA topoisomerase 2-binding protein 1 [Portunus trituberculatus]|uniref:DNA topoisomerase 2-binding protein 1 n=1 Tax=Portunus trituberculatus TaxID=210409 RepID=A0A5B7E1F4_PORTR|nr:DNA topoisomerase 2-binding protein 1 [Portunus trituberculatus]
MPASRPDLPKLSSTTRSKVREISDSFSTSPPPPPAISTETPGREFYRKFYEDIKETMRKYKRKTPLQLQEGRSQVSTAQESQETNSQNRKEQTEEEKCDGPLKGVVVCSSRKFIDQWKEMDQVVTELDGQFLHSYGLEVTHFLFQGRSNDLNKEFRRAKQDGKIVVSPDWLWLCQEKGIRVDEELFPHTYNPNMSLPLTGGMRSPKSKNSLKRKYPEEGEEVEEESSQQQEKQQQQLESKPESESDQEKEKLSKQLEEIGALAQVSGKRSGVGRGRTKPPGEWCRPTAARHVDIETQPISGEEPESQSTGITWEDPVEREARLHLWNQLGGSTEDMMEQNQDQDQQESVEEETKEEDKVRHEKVKEKAAPACNELLEMVNKPSSSLTPVFVLVGMSEEKRQHYSKIVQELGATITLGPTFNPEITHLVAETLSRSERTLAAIASGKWVLHDSYLDHSFQEGHFLQEELYAWGNPAAQHLPPLQPENTRVQLAKAAWRWRCAINGSDGRMCQQPFQHMVALVLSSKDRVGAFTRMIKAGGGEVSPEWQVIPYCLLSPPYGDLRGITHFFVEMDKTTEKVDIEAFVGRGIPCLKPIFINNYLIMDPLPEEEDHYISQYKDLLLSMSGHNQSGVKRLRRE